MTTPQPLGKIGDLARRVQASRFSGLLFTETARTAYLNAAVASQAAPGLTSAHGPKFSTTLSIGTSTSRM